MQTNANDVAAGRAPLTRCLAIARCDEPSRKPSSRYGSATTSWFRTAQFTADGTSLIVQSDDHKLQTFVLPHDLLDDEKRPHELKHYASTASPSCLLSFALYPGYNLSDTNTTWVLTGENDVPVRLRNALDYNHPSHSYPWYHPRTEASHAANSLLFVNGGSHFVVGTRGRLAVFDVERAGERHLAMHKFLKSANLLDRGLVMSLAVSTDGLLAAGTTNRNIALWANSGLGDGGKPELTFQLTPPAGIADDCPGTGVTSMAWSPCQRYLLVAERQSDCIQVFDVRSGGRRLSWLSQRNATSSQKFDFSYRPGSNEVWAGGSDGRLRVWEHPSIIDGEQLPTLTIPLVDDVEYPIGGTCWHPYGEVLATTHGGRIRASHEDNDEMGSRTFNTLKVWDTLRKVQKESPSVS